MILRLITAFKLKKGRHLSMPPSLQRKPSVPMMMRHRPPGS
jgi:hypothetical protein